MAPTSLQLLVSREDNSGCSGSECYGIPSHSLPIGVIVAIVLVVFAVIAGAAALICFLSLRRASRKSRERYQRDYHYRYDNARRSQMTETAFTTTGTQLGTDFGGTEKKHNSMSAASDDGSGILEVPKAAVIR